MNNEITQADRDLLASEVERDADSSTFADASTEIKKLATGIRKDDPFYTEGLANAALRAIAAARRQASVDAPLRDAQRYRVVREERRWQLHPERVLSSDEVDAHYDAILASGGKGDAGAFRHEDSEDHDPRSFSEEDDD